MPGEGLFARSATEAVSPERSADSLGAPLRPSPRESAAI